MENFIKNIGEIVGIIGFIILALVVVAFVVSYVLVRINEKYHKRHEDFFDKVFRDDGRN